MKVMLRMACTIYLDSGKTLLCSCSLRIDGYILHLMNKKLEVSVITITEISQTILELTFKKFKKVSWSSQ